MNYVLTACISLFLASFVAADHHVIPKFCSSNVTKCKLAGLNVTCVNATSDSCAKDVADKKADLTLAPVNDLVKNADKLRMVYGQKLVGLDKFVFYYGLAVVQKDANFNFSELKGKKSCHTGVGRTVGWKIPVGHLLFTKEMKYTKDQYQSVSDFFGDSCAPGINKTAGVSDEVKKDLCKLCNGTCKGDATEPYQSYTGAFKCMAEGNNDRVGFVKQTTADDVIKDDPKYGPKSNYKLLCSDGTTKALTEFKDCNIGVRPASALVTNKDTSDAMVKKMQDMLKNADLGDLKNGGIVRSYTESLQKYSKSVKEYVGAYGDYYNALSGKGIPSTVPPTVSTTVPTTGNGTTTTKSAAPSNLVSFALQVIVIFAFVFLV